MFVSWATAGTVVNRPSTLEATVSRDPSRQVWFSPTIVEGTDLRFQRLPRSQGLSQTRVRQMVQDDQGFIWFGTQHGLNRYDGYKFKTFSHIPGHLGSLSGVFVYALFKDRQGAIWVGTDQSLDRYDPKTETFIHYKTDAYNPAITHISQDRSGWLWLSTRNGLYRLNPDTGATTRFAHVPGNPGSLPTNDIKSSGEDRTGRLWVATSEGLDEFDPQHAKVLLHVPLRVEVQEFTFHEDRSGVFWIAYGSGNGLAVLDRASNNLISYRLQDEVPSGGASGGVYAMLEDRDGSMWFATMGQGLLRYNRDLRQFVRYRSRPGEPDSLADNRVISLLEDRESNIWMGLHATTPNYFSQRPPAFEKYEPALRLREALGEKLVNTVYSDRSGRLWMGAGGALYTVDRQTNRYTPRPLTPSGGSVEVLDIREDAAGAFWVATQGQGLHRIRSPSGRSTAFVHKAGDPTSLSNNGVTRAFIDRRGTLWAASLDGLNRFDPVRQNFSVFKRDPQTASESFFDIAEDRNGVLWLGSPRGLYGFDPRNHGFIEFKHDPANSTTISNNTVNTVFVSRSGQIWLGTQNGLDLFDPVTARFKAYYVADGLAGNAVNCILEDEREILWMSTNNGISSFDPIRGIFKNYTTVDGLPGLDLTASGACSKSLAGEMFFGGFDGATSFFPDRVVDDTYRPPVVFTDFRISGVTITPDSPTLHGQSIGKTSELTLGHEVEEFTIEFAALSFASPATNRYRYRMEGLDPGWRERNSDRRNVSFTTLPPGRYVFTAQAATSRGPWSEPGTTLRILVLPPWWSTWLFRALCVVLAVIILGSAYLMRMRQVSRDYAIRLDERVAERTRIARELHDSLLQGFQGLVFRLQGARNLLPHQVPDAMTTIDVVMDRADAAMTEARAAVQAVRAAPETDVDLVESITALGEELKLLTPRSARAPQLHVMVEGRTRRLQYAVRDEVYRIAREALRNVYRHSGAGDVWVELTYARTRFKFLVRDNGVGMARSSDRWGSITSEGWGLQGMRERASRLGATWRIWSEPGAGTVVQLVIKARVAFGVSTATQAQDESNSHE